VTANKKIDDEIDDACPFPPGSEPPEKEGRVTESLLNFYDDFFGDWRIVGTILTVASLVLAYSLSVVPPPLVTERSVPDAWNRSPRELLYPPYEWAEWTPKYERQIVHEGDLVLEGDETLVIENATYILNGALLARDRAKLIVRNAELYNPRGSRGPPNETLFPPMASFGMAFNDSASLEMYNSSTNGSHKVIALLGGSEATIDSSEGVSIEIDEDSKLHVSNSEITVSAARDARAEIVNSEVFGVGCKSAIDWARLKGRDPLETEPVWENCSVEIWNSTAQNIYVTLKNCRNATASKSLLGYFDYWNPYTDLNVDGSAFNITLHDTNVARLIGLTAYSGSIRVVNQNELGSLTVINGSASIVNSSLPYLGLEKGAQSLVEECAIKRLRMTDGSRISMARSKVEEIFFWNENELALDNVLIDEISLSPAFEVYLRGSIKFGENASIESLPRFSWLCVRNFDVLARGPERALPNVEMTLYDKNGTRSGGERRAGTGGRASM